MARLHRVKFNVQIQHTAAGETFWFRNKINRIVQINIYWLYDLHIGLIKWMPPNTSLVHWRLGNIFKRLVAILRCKREIYLWCKSPNSIFFFQFLEDNGGGSFGLSPTDGGMQGVYQPSQHDLLYFIWQCGLQVDQVILRNPIFIQNVVILWSPN